MTTIDLRPGPGWNIVGLDRGAGLPPAPPPEAVTRGLLDRRQAEVLAGYVELCALLSASRDEWARLRAELDRASADDLAAAADAFAERAGTAPPSVAGARQAEADRQRRYSEAALAAAAEALGEVYAALAAPEVQVRLLTKAWAELVEGRRDPQSVRLGVERVCWVLDLQDRLAPTSPPAPVRAVEALPALAFAEGLDVVLDDLGAQVAARIAELTEVEAEGVPA
jgi:hypothetical protein